MRSVRLARDMRLLLSEKNHVDDLIYPEIFDVPVRAFFTSGSVGADAGAISNLLGMDEDDVYLPIQRHTDLVLAVDSNPDRMVADAVVTQRKGLLVGVQVADCVPILLCDQRTLIVGAVHAGWRGTASQIIKKTIRLMIDRFHSRPQDIRIAIGPSIRGECYEVDSEVKDAICRVTGEGAYCVRTHGKYHVDLASANTVQALSSGIPQRNIWISGICTFCNHTLFHSYRYHGDSSGRQGGFIGVF